MEESAPPLTNFIQQTEQSTCDSKRNDKQCLANAEVTHLKDIRQHLHQHPELSSAEWNTAQYVVDYVRAHSEPTEVYTNVGETGVVAVYDSKVDGAAILFRAELDALPIAETNSFSYKSVVDGVSHKCGHDGHCTTLLGLSRLLNRRAVKKGKVYLLFQPAEETGTGAESILRDEVYVRNVKPDYVFAFHNIPGSYFCSLS